MIFYNVIHKLQSCLMNVCLINETQCNNKILEFYWLYTYIYIHIYIYTYIYDLNIYIYIWLKPTTTEFRSDALTNWAIRSWVQFTLRANFVQLLQFHRLFWSDYKYTLKYKYNIIWFNPPFSKNVTTNAAKIFFRLLDKQFPKSKTLHKIINRNTVKVSYSCMENVSKIIKKTQ